MTDSEYKNYFMKKLEILNVSRRLRGVSDSYFYDKRREICGMLEVFQECDREYLRKQLGLK